MMWIQHGNNYELQTPKDFPFSFWINHKESGGFGVCIYAGTTLTVQQYVETVEEGKAFVLEWMEDFIGKSLDVVEQMIALVDD